MLRATESNALERRNPRHIIFIEVRDELVCWFQVIFIQCDCTKFSRSSATDMSISLTFISLPGLKMYRMTLAAFHELWNHHHAGEIGPLNFSFIAATSSGPEDFELLIIHCHMQLSGQRSAPHYPPLLPL